MCSSSNCTFCDTDCWFYGLKNKNFLKFHFRKGHENLNRNIDYCVNCDFN